MDVRRFLFPLVLAGLAPACAGVLVIEPPPAADTTACETDSACLLSEKCVEGVCELRDLCSLGASDGRCPGNELACADGVCVVVHYTPDECESCPSGELCLDGVCQNLTYCDCTEDEICVAGVCEAKDTTTAKSCSPSQPDGYCPMGETCVGGGCVPIVRGTNDCTPERPTGLCPSGSACQNGYCRPIADDKCSPSNLTGLCPPGQSCKAPGTCLFDPCGDDNPFGRCPVDQWCVAATCEGQACEPDHPKGVCEDGKVCSVLGNCIDVGACEQVEDCAGQVCSVAKVCVDHCAVLADCEVYEYCESDSCVENTTCTSSANCKSPKRCVGAAYCGGLDDCIGASDCADTDYCSAAEKCIEKGKCYDERDCPNVNATDCGGGGCFCGDESACLLPGWCSNGNDCQPGHVCCEDGDAGCTRPGGTPVELGACVTPDADTCDGNILPESELPASHVTGECAGGALRCCSVDGGECCDEGERCSVVADGNGSRTCLSTGDRQCLTDDDCMDGFYTCGDRDDPDPWKCTPTYACTLNSDCDSVLACQALHDGCRCSITQGCIPKVAPMAAACTTNAECGSVFLLCDVGGTDACVPADTAISCATHDGNAGACADAGCVWDGLASECGDQVCSNHLNKDACEGAVCLWSGGTGPCVRASSPNPARNDREDLSCNAGDADPCAGMDACVNDAGDCECVAYDPAQSGVTFCRPVDLPKSCVTSGDCSLGEQCNALRQCEPAGSCGLSAYGASLTTPGMLIVLDRSGSMNICGPGDAQVDGGNACWGDEVARYVGDDCGDNDNNNDCKVATDPSCAWDATGAGSCVEECAWRDPNPGWCAPSTVPCSALSAPTRWDEVVEKGADKSALDTLLAGFGDRIDLGLLSYPEQADQVAGACKGNTGCVTPCNWCSCDSKRPTGVCGDEFTACHGECNLNSSVFCRNDADCVAHENAYGVGAGTTCVGTPCAIEDCTLLGACTTSARDYGTGPGCFDDSECIDVPAPFNIQGACTGPNNDISGRPDSPHTISVGSVAGKCDIEDTKSCLTDADCTGGDGCNTAFYKNDGTGKLDAGKLFPGGATPTGPTLRNVLGDLQDANALGLSDVSRDNFLLLITDGAASTEDLEARCAGKCVTWVCTGADWLACDEDSDCDAEGGPCILGAEDDNSCDPTQRECGAGACTILGLCDDVGANECRLDEGATDCGGGTCLERGHCYGGDNLGAGCRIGMDADDCLGGGVCAMTKPQLGRCDGGGSDDASCRLGFDAVDCATDGTCTEVGYCLGGTSEGAACRSGLVATDCAGGGSCVVGDAAPGMCDAGGFDGHLCRFGQDAIDCPGGGCIEIGSCHGGDNAELACRLGMDATDCPNAGVCWSSDCCHPTKEERRACFINSALANLRNLNAANDQAPNVQSFVVGYNFPEGRGALNCHAVNGGQSTCATPAQCYSQEVATEEEIRRNACGQQTDCIWDVALAATDIATACVSDPEAECQCTIAACDTEVNQKTEDELRDAACTSLSSCLWTLASKTCSGGVDATNCAVTLGETCYFSADNRVSLASSLAAIAQQVASCRFESSRPDDLQRIGAYLRYGETLVRVPSGQWQLCPNPAECNASTIVITYGDEACNAIRAGQAEAILALTCKTGDEG